MRDETRGDRRHDVALLLASEPVNGHTESSVARHAVIVAVLLLSTGVFTFARLENGWIPHDEGTLAHAAERVLSGELPHRDFAEVYTGGLSYINAIAFRVMGTNLMSLRIVLFSLFLITVPAFYYLAYQFHRPVAAGLLALLAAAWSLPTYAAAMPSWYNLFLAVLGSAALVRHVNTSATKWVFVAGILGGVSCLVKITGLYFVAAGLLCMVFLSQESNERPSVANSTRYASAFIALALLLFLVAVGLLVAPRLGWAEFLHFVVPSLAVVALLVRREWTCAAPMSRLTGMGLLVTTFMAGVILPIVVFVLPYLWTDSIAALVDGVFLAPGSRLASAAVRPPAPGTLVSALPIIGVLVLGRSAGLIRRTATYLLWCLLALCFFGAGDPRVYRPIWESMRWLPPIAVVTATLLLWRGADHATSGTRKSLFIMAALVATTALIQYPFSAPVYFFYVGPIVVLLMGGVFLHRETHPRMMSGSLVAFYLMFTAMWIYPGYLYNMGSHFAYDTQTESFALQRAPLKVTAFDKWQYENVVSQLHAHAVGGYVFAGPDAPEVYFLSGLRNPTRHIFEFLSRTGDQERAILEALRQHDVHVVALKAAPEFSGPYSESMYRELARRFPNAVQIGRFHVRWRE